MYKVTIILPNQYWPKLILTIFIFCNTDIFVLLPTKVVKWSLPLFRRELFEENSIAEFLPNTKYPDRKKE